MKTLHQKIHICLVHFWTLSICFLLVASALGVQSERPSESTDPYFAAPTKTRAPKESKVSSSNMAQSWSQNGSSFAPSEFPVNSPSNSIIRQSPPSTAATVSQSQGGPEFAKNQTYNPSQAVAITSSKPAMKESPFRGRNALEPINDGPIATPWDRGGATGQNENSSEHLQRSRGQQFDQQQPLGEAPNLQYPTTQSPQIQRSEIPQSLVRQQPALLTPITPDSGPQQFPLTDLSQFQSKSKPIIRNGPDLDSSQPLAVKPELPFENKVKTPPQNEDFQPGSGTTSSSGFGEIELPKITTAHPPKNKPHDAREQPSTPEKNKTAGNNSDFQPNEFVSDWSRPKNSQIGEKPKSTARQNYNRIPNEFFDGQLADSADKQSIVAQSKSAPKSTPNIATKAIDKPDSIQPTVSSKIPPRSRKKYTLDNKKTIGTEASTELAPSKPLSKASVSDSTKDALSGDLESFEPGRVLALVGGEPIFAGDLTFEVNSIIQKLAPTAPESVKRIQRPLLMKKLLNKFIDSKLLYVSTVRGLPEQADLNKILEQADREFDDKALATLMEQSGVKTTAEFDAHLRLMGSSLRKLRRSWATEQLVRYFLSQQLNVDTEVSHQEMLDYYREHEEDYRIPARSKWEQVMVRYDKFSSHDEAHKSIVEMGNKIVFGAKLSAVAKESSHGFRANEGGQHDWTSRNALVLKEVDKTIFEAPLGELSEIFESRDGFHIVRVIERTDQTKTSFLDAQVEIRRQLEDQKRQDAFQEHLKKLKRDIPVEIFELAPDEKVAGQAYTLTK